MAYRELSHREKVADSSARVTVLKQIGEVLAQKAGVVSYRVKVGVHQLAWIQDSAVGSNLYAVRLHQYCAGVWRLTDRYQPEVPKTYWAGERSCHLIRGVQGFEWSCLIEEFDVKKSASLIHSMVSEGTAWDWNNFGKRWMIFPENDHAHYAFTPAGKRHSYMVFNQGRRIKPAALPLQLSSI